MPMELSLIYTDATRERVKPAVCACEKKEKENPALISHRNGGKAKHGKLPDTIREGFFSISIILF